MKDRNIKTIMLIYIFLIAISLFSFPGAAGAMVFQNSDVAFLVDASNGSCVVADTGNVRDASYLKGMSTLYEKLNSSAEFKKMVQFYKESYAIRIDNQKKDIVVKIAELENMPEAARQNKAIISYYRAELKKLDEKTVPPLTIYFDQGKERSSSHMVPEKIVYKDKNGNRVEAPNYIVYARYAIDYLNAADASENVKGLITLAHESGHVISNNTNGPATTNYRDNNANYVNSDRYKNIPEAAEIMKNGDPLPSAHWFGKVTNPDTAFEEGFAEFSGAFFSVSGHNADNIADGNFYMYRDAYYIETPLFSSEKYAGCRGATYQLKTTDELVSTEFFVAKMLYRVSKSFKDPNAGYEAIMKIKNGPEFAANKSFSTFVKIFAREYPQNYANFKSALDAEAGAKLSEARSSGGFWASLKKGFDGLLISLKLKKPTLGDITPAQKLKEAEALGATFRDIEKVGDSGLAARTTKADPGTAVTRNDDTGDGAVPQKRTVSPALKERLDACFKRYIDYMGSPDADAQTLEKYKNDYLNAMEEMKKATGAR